MLINTRWQITQATPEQVPYLRGAPEWRALIYRDTVTPTNPALPRTEQTLRLLQIDITVRDDSNTMTGWVFGTFINIAEADGINPWKRMVPIGLCGAMILMLLWQWCAQELS